MKSFGQFKNGNRGKTIKRPLRKTTKVPANTNLTFGSDTITNKALIEADIA